MNVVDNGSSGGDDDDDPAPTTSRCGPASDNVCTRASTRVLTCVLFLLVYIEQALMTDDRPTTGTVH